MRNQEFPGSLKRKFITIFVKDQVMLNAPRTMACGSMEAKGFNEIFVCDFGVGIFADVEKPP
jgi:hypothetical protein